MIIVTGCDNTGKTTLTQHLLKVFSKELQEVEKYHTLPPVDEEDWYNWLGDTVMYETGSSKTFIADRFFIDELVYGPIMRDGCIISDHKIDYMQYRLRLQKTLVIICDPGLRQTLINFESREQYPDSDMIPRIIDGFNYYKNSYGVGLSVIEWNYTIDKDKKKITNKVGKYLDFLTLFEEEKK